MSIDGRVTATTTKGSFETLPLETKKSAGLTVAATLGTDCLDVLQMLDLERDLRAESLLRRSRKPVA